MAKRSPRISDAFSLHNRRMTDAEIRDTARGVMRILLAKLEGDPTNIQSWLDLARSLGIRVIGFYGPRGEALAYYDNSEYEKGKSLGPFPSPRLVYNLCAPLEWRIFLILHEVAHHVGAQWPGSAFPKAATERYDDIRQTAQHRVACAVEELFYDTFFCASQTNISLHTANQNNPLGEGEQEDEES
ncbi:MAG: hypothetical protein NTX57_00505 [Armatimonadetes bacterium]|nr:hypothetical protein [Armatimonadota bacterium]